MRTRALLAREEVDLAFSPYAVARILVDKRPLLLQEKHQESNPKPTMSGIPPSSKYHHPTVQVEDDKGTADNDD